jgi:hypothetical protein
MRTLSTRERESIRERIEFVRQEAERERLAQDEIEYQKYRKTVLDENRGLPPAYHIEVLPFAEWRQYIPEDEKDPFLRAAMATNKALVHRTAMNERESVLNGRDPNVFIAPELNGARMSAEAAATFNREQARRFRENTVEYFPTQTNFEAITNYCERNGLEIINESMFRAAFERLRSFGAIQERTEPEPIQEPITEPEPVTTEPEVYLGIDPNTGREREYTTVEVHRMTADQFMRAFQVTREKRIADLAVMDALGRLAV